MEKRRFGEKPKKERKEEWEIEKNRENEYRKLGKSRLRGSEES